MGKQLKLSQKVVRELQEHPSIAKYLSSGTPSSLARNNDRYELYKDFLSLRHKIDNHEQLLRLDAVINTVLSSDIPRDPEQLSQMLATLELTAKTKTRLVNTLMHLTGKNEDKKIAGQVEVKIDKAVIGWGLDQAKKIADTFTGENEETS